MRLRAMAKINLALDVLGRRPDGYHDVRMIMQTISMYDALDIQIKKEPGIELRTNLPYVPEDSRNLAYKAADLLMQEFHIKEGLQIHLEKFIPVSAGMAGGSSDAAAVLVGVNNLFRLGLSKQELMKRGSTLGADIPYCVMRGTALAEGIGEKLTPLPSVPECSVLVGKPPVSVSTKAAYESLRLDVIDQRPDIDGMIESLKTGDLRGITSRMQNVFQPGISGAHPVIGDIIKLMEDNGAMKAIMSGSGPSVFGIYEKRKDASNAAEKLRSSGMARTVYVARMFRVDKPLI
ncbi:MAG: 4-(cytidine 5'-diphospho)-2-C-methyl-D-erythritol kinase [Blautia sp.]|nr:4-(cytidine 5'-diphospho)-2-C-methyl-D-erythritol kinase [Blautia sp.]